LFGDGSFGDKQLKRNCGLGPLNTFKRAVGSDASNVAIPLASALTGELPLAMSQCSPTV
jgi:hypothetical protein